jgi:hypothetical protein
VESFSSGYEEIYFNYTQTGLLNYALLNKASMTAAYLFMFTKQRKICWERNGGENFQRMPMRKGCMYYL